VHSDTDNSVPIKQALDMSEAMQQAEAPFEFLHYKDRGHMGITDEVVEVSKKFIDKVCQDQPLNRSEVKID
jgi:dipeptidyl aminopeptidase/acylaminoacyl peptidase